MEMGNEADLPGFDVACASVGLKEMPAGLAEMTKRQRDFCFAYLRCGSSTKAAAEAGYANPAPDGSKAMRHPKVAAFLAQASLPLVKDADQLVRRAGQRSIALHALFVAELDKPDTLRSSGQLLRLEQACNKADMLLGSLLGKVIGVAGSLDVKHTHELAQGSAQIPEAMLMPLARMRREMRLSLAPLPQGGTN